MADYTFERTQVVPVPLEEAFTFFADPHNLEAITPPWLRFRIVSAPRELSQGALLAYRLRLWGVPIRWVTEIVAWSPPRTFTDVQLSGPYRLWEHTHRLTPLGAETEIYDHVRYRLPFEPLAGIVEPRIVRRWLGAIFGYRSAEIARRLSNA